MCLCLDIPDLCVNVGSAGVGMSDLCFGVWPRAASGRVFPKSPGGPGSALSRPESTEEDPEGTEQARDHPIGSTVTFASPQKRMTQARPPGGRDVERPPGTERPRAAPSVPKRPCGIDREQNFPAQPRTVPSGSERHPPARPAPAGHHASSSGLGGS